MQTSLSIFKSTLSNEELSGLDVIIVVIIGTARRLLEHLAILVKMKKL